MRVIIAVVIGASVVLAGRSFQRPLMYHKPLTSRLRRQPATPTSKARTDRGGNCRVRNRV